MTMTREIKEITQKAQNEWKDSKVPIQIKSLVNQLTLDIQTMMDKGEWDFAVKLSYYRHEVAKTITSLIWYDPFVEIRKTRDLIALLADDRTTDSS